ncbi:MAG: hypothetical protein GF331_26245 [Chitinivibrionales bacterium]|nr:hypothetical protein [Chitinivibrionales bacterium]
MKIVAVDRHWCRPRCTLAVALSSVLVFLSVATAQVTTVTLNPAETHQTIEGFGSMLKIDIGIRDSVNLGKASYRQFIIEDFGLTVFRPWLPMTEFEPVNDNNDPNVLNMDGFHINRQMRFIIYCINQLKSYPHVKFIPAVLSPPAWMKTNNNIANGYLRTDMYEEFAEYLVAFYRMIQQETGMDLYGLSIQNESAFHEWYGSCVYTAEEYRDVLKVVGARFEAEGIDTRLHGADDMLTNITVTPYFGYIYQDPVARQYLSAVSVHGYSDGVNPMPTSGAAQAWQRLGDIADRFGVPAWMNECAGWMPNDYMPAAMHMGMALRYADLSLWVYLSMDDCEEWGLLCNGEHTLRSAAAKHYYHFLRPGAVRIGAAYTEDEYLLVNAFVHPETNTMNVVAVNNASATRQIQLTAPDMPATMRMYLTTSTGGNKLCEDQGDVSTGGAIDLPAASVVTLNADYVTSIGNATPDRAQSSPRADMGTRLVDPNARFYLLDGTVARPRSPAAGLRILATPHGATLVPAKLAPSVMGR